MTNKEKVEQVEIPKGYGFFRNLHLKSLDIEKKISFIENFSDHLPYYYTMRSIFKLTGGLFIPPLLGVWYLTNNVGKQKYIFLPLLLIYIGIIILTVQWSLMERTGGTLLKHSFTFFKEWTKERSEKRGKRKRFKALGIKDIDRYGRIEFSSGDYGYLYEVDGNLSRTSYPAEIVAQAAISSEYQNSRNHTSYETKITSSSRQSVEEQRKHMEKQAEKFKDKNDALYDMCQLQANVLSQNIEGRMLTIEQHLMIADPSEIKLEEYANRLAGFVNGTRGMDKLYKNARRLSQNEAIEFLTRIHSLK